MCCFTDECDNIKMWSHYGDKHKGICLIFDTRYKFFNGLQQVRYVSTRPKVPLMRRNDVNRKTSVLDILTSKFESWTEESEWRLFRVGSNRGYTYPKSALKGVIFGLACTAEDQDMVLRLFSNVAKIDRFKVTLCENEYKLEVVKME